MTFAMSIYAANKDGTSRHGVGCIECDGEDQALGMALKICRKLYPSSDGWYGHDALVQETDDPIKSVEAAKLTPVH